MTLSSDFVNDIQPIVDRMMARLRTVGGENDALREQVDHLTAKLKQMENLPSGDWRDRANAALRGVNVKLTEENRKLTEEVLEQERRVHYLENQLQAKDEAIARLREENSRLAGAAIVRDDLIRAPGQNDMVLIVPGACGIAVTWGEHCIKINRTPIQMFNLGRQFIDRAMENMEPRINAEYP